MRRQRAIQHLCRAQRRTPTLGPYAPGHAVICDFVSSCGGGTRQEPTAHTLLSFSCHLHQQVPPPPPGWRSWRAPPRPRRPSESCAKCLQLFSSRRQQLRVSIGNKLPCVCGLCYPAHENWTCHWQWLRRPTHRLQQGPRPLHPQVPVPHSAVDSLRHTAGAGAPALPLAVAVGVSLRLGVRRP
jgi:hypothetical protein